ncbi:hypothetical protein B0T26DRAFT_709393 [Lasiosphaeria miniovina]|uniref:Heterokaryon incompatibility domain-containing protein n=1 Tax=Lasiosphaeria miniovina TaxID=1954250 RepID=A0AA40AK58_9PEZI|nr:uncharacterized protein B0T26DRAFT_709393 [Lasiosphaeria miniovina]KAK0717282.1 hypothetical protein B0T26DRAFT_709393 [Lasiosphaeria miniovina]
MGDIYRAAQSVAVWLGSSTPNSQAAFRLLRQIHAAAQATAAADRDRLLTKAELARRGLPDDSGPDWKAVGLLFWRPWFTRVWIIQEVALARSSAVYCGGDSMPWHEFVGAADFIRLQYHALWVDLDLMPAVQLQQAAKLAHSGQPRDLLWLLSTFRDRFATNPADKIYGLLGLAPADHGVVPNYSAPVQQTYCEVARMLLQGQGSLDVLSLVGDSSWRRTPNLPSWVPDWATDLAADPYLFRSIAHVFHACGTATMSRAVVRFSPDGNTLTVRGALLDRVAAVGDRHLMSRRLSYDRFEESSILRHLCGKDTRRQFAAWERMVRSLGTYPTGEEIEDVLQRALVAGTDSAADPSRVGPQTTAPVPPRLYVAFRERHLALLEESKRDKAGHASTQASADLAARYNLSIKPAANGRRLFTTKRGYVGFGPMSTKSGDSVVLFRGGRTAYILREYRKKRKEQVISYALVGEAFVHGMMNGEGFADESTALSNFDLV